MKTRNEIGIMTKKVAIIAIFALAIIALAFIGCKDEPSGPPPEQPQTQPDTVRTLSFGTAENPCSVTIKSDDKFLAAEWTTLCDKTVAAIMRGYNKDMGGVLPNLSNKDDFETLFATSSISIVLLSSSNYNCKVTSNDYSTIFLKISALDTIDLQPAILFIVDKDGTEFYQAE